MQFNMPRCVTVWPALTTFLSIWSLQTSPSLSQLVCLIQVAHFSFFLILHSLSREASPPFLISCCLIITTEHWLEKKSCFKIHTELDTPSRSPIKQLSKNKINKKEPNPPKNSVSGKLANNSPAFNSALLSLGYEATHKQIFQLAAKMLPMDPTQATQRRNSLRSLQFYCRHTKSMLVAKKEYVTYSDSKNVT